MRTEFGPEGDIRSTDILAALVTLWRESASGTLQFSRSGATSGFDLASGEVVGTSASEARFDTAAILVRANKLDETTLERLTAGSGSDRALTALNAGVLTKREWRWGEKIRAVEVLSDLLTWIEGDYTFFRTSPREAGEFRLTIPRLILELFLRSRDRGLVLHHLGGVDVPLVRDSRFDTEFATFGLTDDAESVVRLIDGESTAAEIAAEAPAEPFAVEKLLAALVTLGLVHPAYAVDDSHTAAPGPVAVESIPVPSLEAEAVEPPEAVEEDLDVRARDADEEEEELEPEVDISERPDIGTPPAPEYDPLEDEVPAADETEEPLVDADMETPGARKAEVTEGIEAAEEAEAIEEGETLAADLEASQSAPDRFDQAVEAEPSSVEYPGTPIEFERPLDTSTGVGSMERPQHRSSASWFAVLGVLVAIVAGVLYWRSRGPSAPAEPAPMAAATSTIVPTRAEQEAIATPSAAPTVAAIAAPAPRSTAAPTTRPTVAPPTARPTVAAPTPRATFAPKRAPTAAPRRPSTAEPAPARPQSRAGWLARAERDQKSAEADRQAQFAVQLELVCEIPSLTEAFSHDRPAGTMWVVTTSYRGKTCFRVLWGRYPSRDAAESGKAQAPSFFATSRNHPMVVPLSDTRR